MEKFGSCLVITRHELLESQRKDIEDICRQIVVKPELPVDASKLSQFIDPFDAVIGTFPISLQLEILKNKKALITFVMKSLGVADDEKGARELASKYENMTVVLTPSKPGEKYRVLLYEGIKRIVEIKVVDEWVIRHSS